MPTTPEISVVVAVRNGADTLPAALHAIRASDVARERIEIIVVDDSSDDASAAVASRYADMVVRLGGRRHGPAYARNRGAELARGGLVAFVDADVVVQPNTLSEMARAFAGDPSLDAASARYAGTSPVRGLVSQYWSLLLLYGDDRQGDRAPHLFGACAMVRRSVFERAGMFDEWRFHTACLEDVEFGRRLLERGLRVETLAQLEVTHLRRTTVRRLVSDVWERSELMARSLGYKRTRSYAPYDVVFALSGATVPAITILAALSLSAAAVQHNRLALWVAIALVIGPVANMRACAFFTRKRGLLLAMALLPVHVLSQAVSVVAICTGWVLRDAIGDRIPDATIQAYSEVGVEMWPPVPRRS